MTHEKAEAMRDRYAENNYYALDPTANLEPDELSPGWPPGTQVTYAPDSRTEEPGIIKSRADEDHYFVVYKWSDEPENYANYTGARTRAIDLLEGWTDENGELI